MTHRSRYWWVMEAHAIAISNVRVPRQIKSSFTNSFSDVEHFIRFILLLLQ